MLNEITTANRWLAMGDFNCVLRGVEKSSGDGVSRGFVNQVEHLGLIDLGYMGHNFTWNHGSNVESRRFARMDRTLCSNSWRCLFNRACVKHLHHAHSDHFPLLL